MNNGMTIGAKRHQIILWVNFVHTTNLRKWLFVMNLDKAIRYCAINFTEIKTASVALVAEILNTLQSRFLASFVTVYKNLNNLSFFEKSLLVVRRIFRW